MNKFFLKVVIILTLIVFIQVIFGNVTYIFASDKNQSPSKVKITSVCVDNCKATIKWKKVNNADGYVIYMSNSKKGKYKKIKTIKSKNITKYTKNNLNEANEYYFKIKAYKNINGKKIYSNSFSNIKSGGGILATKVLTASKSTIDRNINLKIASSKIDGIILKPGQTFKWSKVIGNMTESMGYRKAIAYVNGGNRLSAGGGVCQVSTTLYQCAKQANLKITERHEHGKEVTYIESGEDATVTYGLRDLAFKNNTKYTIKIRAFAEGNSTMCQFFKISEK